MKKSRACMVGVVLLWSTLSNANESNVVIKTIGVGDTPAGIAVTPDSLFAYVANNNNDGILNGDTVSVLNLTYNTVETTISDSSFGGPYTVTINAAGTKAYVTNSNLTTVTIIDLTTNQVTGTIDGFEGPSGFAITPDGKHAYVNNYGVGEMSGLGTTVSYVDLRTNVIVGMPITVDLAPAALAITPDGAFVYVACYTDGTTNMGTVRVIRTSDNTVVGPAITGFSGPFVIAITPNGKYAYVTNFGSNNFTPVGTTVSVVSIRSNTIVDTILLGIQPAGIAITPDGTHAYVSNYSTVYNDAVLTPSQGTVDVIDLRNNTVSSSIIGGVGLSPASMTISPNGQFAYVSNYSSNTVSVIALPSPTYNIDRLTPHYNLQQDETVTKLNQAGL